MHILAILAENQEQATSMPCYYFLILGGAAIVLYVTYILYHHFIGRWIPSPHYCRYCGKMVRPISSCCHSAVDDHSLPPVCKKCLRSTGLVCSVCKREI